MTTKQQGKRVPHRPHFYNTNDLQAVFELQGQSIRRLAQTAGCGYHSLQKTIKGIYNFKKARQIIADYFQVSEESLFGKNRPAVIRYLIEREIEKQAKEKREEFRRLYLSEN